MIQIVNPTVIGGSVALFVFFGILALLVVGRWFGKRVIAQHGGEGPSTIGSLETAVFALLGLLIAFTFSDRNGLGVRVRLRTPLGNGSLEISEKRLA